MNYNQFSSTDVSSRQTQPLCTAYVVYITYVVFHRIIYVFLDALHNKTTDFIQFEQEKRGICVSP